MPRKRSELGPGTEARIVALMRAGGTADSIAAQLGAEGVKASRATIGRRMQELKGKVSAARAERFQAAPPVEAAPLPPSADDIPEGASLEMLDRWLATAKRMGEIAESEGDLDALATAGRLSVSLLEAKRKATPPTRPDPNDNPDMVKLGGEVAARLHKMIDQVTTG